MQINQERLDRFMGQVVGELGTDERYVREWLSAQAAGGYVAYDAASKMFTLPDEQAFALAFEDSPAYLPGAFEILRAVIKDEPKVLEAFRTGDGVGWDERVAARAWPMWAAAMALPRS